MGKWVRRIAFGLGVVLVAVAAALVYVAATFDPDDYRDEIREAVRKRTGRDLRIRGDLSLELFPWLAVRTGRMELGDAPGFGDAPFAEVRSVAARVRLLPLLRGEIEVGEVRIEGLRLRLRVDASGRSNWADLAAGNEEGDDGGKEEQAAGGRGGAAGLALTVAGLEVRDARIEYVDEQAGRGFTLAGLELRTGALRPGVAVPVRLATDIEAEPAGFRGRLEFAATATVAEALDRLRLGGLELHLQGEGAGLPEGGLEAVLRGEITAGATGRVTAEDLELTLPGLVLAGRLVARGMERAELVLDSRRLEPGRLLAAFGVETPLPADSPLLASGGLGVTARLAGERLEIPRLRVTLGPLRLEASLAVPRIGARRLEGRVEIAPFSPRELAAAAGVALPPTADPQALGRAAARFALAADPQGVAVRELTLELDETRIDGRVRAAGLHRSLPALRFALAVDALDLDRYLPPAAEKRAPPAPGAAAVGTAELPLEPLRALDAEGTLEVGRLKAFGIRSEQVRIALQARDGLIRLGPNRARLYGGTYAGDLRLDVRGEEPVYRTAEALSGVDVGSLLRDAAGEKRLEGRADLRLRLAARGAGQERLRRTVGGEVRFAFRDGLVRGINIARMIREARARLEGRPPPKDPGPNETDFTELAGTLRIRGGVVRNDDLVAKSPLLRVAGAGTVDLPAETVDYLLRVKLVGTLAGQGGAELADLRGVEIPIRIRGPWAKPSFGVELERILAGRAKAKLEAEKARARARLEEKKKALEEKVKRKLEQKLKGLFQ